MIASPSLLFPLSPCHDPHHPQHKKGIVIVNRKSLEMCVWLYQWDCKHIFLGNVLRGCSDEGYFLNEGPISIIHFLNPYESCSHTFFSAKLCVFFFSLLDEKKI